MKLENPFTELAYKFYPKGISEIDREEYLKSNQQINLQNRRSEAIVEISELWSNLINILKICFPDSYISTYDHFVKTIDRSFALSINIRENKIGSNSTCYVLHLSILFNYFIIYTINPLRATYGLEENSVNFQNLETDDIYQTICSEVANSFPSYQLFPDSLIRLTIDDIMFDGVGVMDDDSKNLHPAARRMMTNFNAFFSSNYYYNA